VICQFGVMFFPDKLSGVREALRVLKPGGRFQFNVWNSLDHNPVSRIVSETMAKIFPDDPPRFFERVPFVLDAAVRSIIDQQVDPRLAKDLKSFDFHRVIDNRVVERLVKEGFFQKLFGAGVKAEEDRKAKLAFR
jgi:SAM-dependent methyltransferase